MQPWLKFPSMLAVLAAMTVLAPIAGFAIGTATIVLFHLTGIPATIIVTIAIVGGAVFGVKTVQWLADLRRRRT